MIMYTTAKNENISALTRIIAFVVLVCFVAVPVLSGIVLLEHSSTCHSSEYAGYEDTCTLCIFEKGAGSLCKLIGSAMNCISMLFTHFFSAVFDFASLLSLCGLLSLLALKVRMNN